jgi:hypothetical protein
MPRSPQDIDYGVDDHGIGGPAAATVSFSRAEHAAAHADDLDDDLDDEFEDEFEDDAEFDDVQGVPGAVNAPYDAE